MSLVLSLMFIFCALRLRSRVIGLNCLIHSAPNITS
uniref:Uncharacterized protein n=1 Tax=Arundo donax TaxID=35708 RepID=A0A0A9B2F2_ARUDO